MNKRRLTLGIITTFYVVLITFLSTYNFSGSLPEIDLSNFDKFVHFCFYFGLNTLLLLSLMLFGFRMSVGRILLVTLSSVLYGFVMEIVQLYVGRDFDIFDILANSVGAAVGALFVRIPFVGVLIRKYLL